MSDSRTISGTVSTQNVDSRYRVTLDLMEKIAFHEASSDRKKRDYWLKLYHQCHRATGGTAPADILKDD